VLVVEAATTFGRTNGTYPNARGLTLYSSPRIFLTTTTSRRICVRVFNRAAGSVRDCVVRRASAGRRNRVQDRRRLLDGRSTEADEASRQAAREKSDPVQGR
jgi:hypothetical protein